MCHTRGGTLQRSYTRSVFSILKPSRTEMQTNYHLYFKEENCPVSVLLFQLLYVHSTLRANECICCRRGKITLLII